MLENRELNANKKENEGELSKKEAEISKDDDKYVVYARTVAVSCLLLHLKRIKKNQSDMR